MSKGKPDLSKKNMLALIETELPSHRYKHTLGVVQTALELAERYDADREKAEVAAILHDYAKYRPAAEMQDIIQSVAHIPNDLLHYHVEMWHAFVGAYLVQREVGIEDEHILAAIRYHTTGRPNMTLLEKVVCLADYIEPGRTFPGVAEVRRLAKQDIDLALAKSFQNTISFLKEKGQDVYPLTLSAYESLQA